MFVDLVVQLAVSIHDTFVVVNNFSFVPALYRLLGFVQTLR